MKRCLPALLLLLCLSLSGCAMRRAEEMYALPKRSQEYQLLDTAINEAMESLGLDYCSPQSGENQQSVQTADLDGDGLDEHLVFASGGAEKPLQVLIFRQDPGGGSSLMEVIQSNGTAFEQVEYINFDEKPGLELVVGRQVSDQVLRSMSVYSFSGGRAQLVLRYGYSKFVTCDLDLNGRSELLVLRPGEAATDRGMAVLYSADRGKIQRSVEMELSVSPNHIRRIAKGRLHGGAPAVYVASTMDESTVYTDVLTLHRGQFSNVAFDGQEGTSVETLRNFYVYPEDVDGDGVLELPGLATMKAVSLWGEDEQKYLIRWYALTAEGQRVDKLYTFHDFLGGWYVRLDSDWASRVTVEQDEGRYTFYVWNESYEEATALFTIYIFTGSTRDADVTQDGRFALYRSEEVSYGARLERYAEQYGITEKQLIDAFSPIHQDWQTEET
ncbi:MAG: hypothetical protein Q4F17_05375 [Eubacteriales bacterium]|nr:hypothetical protein [Eubacteriales bacterium]